jgi:hypothetical protein
VLVQRHLFANRRRIARVVASATGNPAVTRLVLDYAMGRRSYRAVRRRVVAGAPMMAMQLAWQYVRVVFGSR